MAPSDPGLAWGWPLPLLIPSCSLPLAELEETLDGIFHFQMPLGVPQAALGQMGLLNWIGS